MSCHLSLPLFRRSFSFPVLMSNALVFIHAGFACVTNSFSSLTTACYSLFPFPSLLFFLSPFNSCPIIPLSSLFSLPYLLLPTSFSLSSLSPTFSFSYFPPSLHINHTLVFLSQGTVLEATVYGLEPYSQYSLRAEAVNEAGRLIMIGKLI